MRTSHLIAGAVAALASGTSLLAQTEQRTVSGSHVAIYNLAGRMRAVPSTGNAVTIDITRGGADRAQLRIETGALGVRQTLRVIYPSDRIVYPELHDRSRMNFRVRDDGTFSDGGWDERGRSGDVTIRGSGPGMEAWADMVVNIPRGQRIELYLAAGRMDVANVEGDILVDVGAAEVDVAGAKGNLVFDTGSGRVAVRDASGNLTLDTGSGGLTVDRFKGDVLNIDSGSGGVRASDVEVRELRADVGSGGLRLFRTRAAIIQAETGSGGVEIDLLSNPETLDVETGSGGATIRVPATLSAQIEAETNSGGFTTDFEIRTRRFNRNHIEGTIGDGKARIRLEAGSGSIRLLKGS